jgi:hypothetical protein
VESDLGTGDNEDNKDESGPLSFCGESVPRCTIISGANARANSLRSTQGFSCDSGPENQYEVFNTVVSGIHGVGSSVDVFNWPGH